MNMLRFQMFAVAIGALAMTGPLSTPAQAQSTIRLGLVGGLSLPAGDLGNSADAGPSIGLRAEGRLGPPRWSMRGDLSFDRFGGRGIVDSYSYSALAGSLVHREDGGHLYEYGGIGAYHARTEYTERINSSDTNLGVQFGIGTEFGTRTRWFVETGLTSAFTSGRSSLWFPIRLGLWF